MGPPGVIRVIKNTAIVAPMMVGMISKKRRMK
jgi:hypothetical protein